MAIVTSQKVLDGTVFYVTLNETSVEELLNAAAQDASLVVECTDSDEGRVRIVLKIVDDETYRDDSINSRLDRIEKALEKLEDSCGEDSEEEEPNEKDAEIGSSADAQ